MNDLIDPYERLFLDDYQFEKNPEYEEDMRKCAAHEAAKSEKIRGICQDLTAFMEDVRAKSLGCPKERAE